MNPFSYSVGNSRAAVALVGFIAIVSAVNSHTDAAAGLPRPHTSQRAISSNELAAPSDHPASPWAEHGPWIICAWRFRGISRQLYVVTAKPFLWRSRSEAV
jgi:hypothetical protein